ncbi:MAG TPA: hypothetical protein VOA87_21820 [Thermoanaerobaculia bacterium]|nr:hypothetical protein [Thermoanaerobaculia bacterium]
MHNPRAFYCGLFATALATLVLEVVDTRLLSVITWYHLAFLAISLAMLGMTAGAVFAYLRPERFTEAAALAQVSRFATFFALSMPLSHLAVLAIRVPTQLTTQPMDLWTLAFASGLLAAPFCFAGVVVAVSLTRVPLPIGRVYAADLLGAGLGCAAAILLLERADPTTVTFLLAALAGLGAAAYRLAAGRGRVIASLALAAALLFVAFANRSLYPRLFWIGIMKGNPVPAPVLYDRWNSHSRVTARAAARGTPALWGAGSATPPAQVEQIPLRIDGGAFTVCTRLEPGSGLDWLRYDLTNLAFQLRGQGEVAVIGVGGGRDVLAALAFGSPHVTGIEVNRLFLDLLEGDLRQFAGLADRPEVTLVHDEGRAYLARSPARFDLLQMALVDTWASTSAGAMTLTENGLYTVQAWRLFLRRLRPSGLLAVSRWYSPDDPGETARLLSLAAATLMEEGRPTPRDHIVLATAGRLSTLILARDPFTADDVARLREAAARYGFSFLVLPGEPVANAALGKIVEARNKADLAAATRHPLLQLEPPTDDRPFFFNMLRPAAWLRRDFARERAGGVIEGNLRATDSLAAIFLVVLALVTATILVPLLARGRGHGLAPGAFAAAAAYFSLIGVGFMLVEIALMQRFSSFLGHPIHSMVVTLMSLIVAAGIGSWLSDALPLRGRAPLFLPLVVAPALVALPFLVRFTAASFAGASLSLKVALVSALTVPAGVLLGFCFPVGMRLVRSRSAAAMSWMWGLNGAFGVLGSVLAVVLSMTFGISRCFLLAALCYLALGVPIALLRPQAD